MCDICEELKTKRRVIIFEGDNRYLSICKYGDIKYYLEFDSDFDLFELPIVYCPMCGRKLE